MSKNLIIDTFLIKLFSFIPLFRNSFTKWPICGISYPSLRMMFDISFVEDGAMAKYKSYSYSQNVLVPISLEEQLMPGTLKFAIHTLLETRINTSILDHRYGNDGTGRLAYDPKILLKNNA